MRGRLTWLTETTVLVEFEGGDTGVIVLPPEDPDVDRRPTPVIDEDAT